MGEFARLIDRQTEETVIRVTTLGSSATLPPVSKRVLVAGGSRSLLFASDRAGAWAPFTMDLRAGVAAQIAAPRQMRSQSLCLTPSGKEACFLDGRVLQIVSLTNRKVQQLAAEVDAFAPAEKPADFIVLRGSRLERIGPPLRVLVESIPIPFAIRPDGNACAFVREGKLWATAFGEAPAEPWLVADSIAGEPCWAPDGRSILFTRPSTNNRAALDLMSAEFLEYRGTAVTNVVAPANFASFSLNGDGSVVVGASRSRAQPSLVLLVRALKRELVLCEHRSNHPESVYPRFSPDSRRVFFNSDFEGKPAIYAMNVERIVEPTS